MAAEHTDRHRSRAFVWVLTLLPILAIMAARLGTHSTLAAEYPRTTALLFLWLAADVLALSLIANAPDHKPGVKSLLGAVTIAVIIVPIAAAPAIREALFAMPAVITAMLATITLYAVWSAAQSVVTYRETRSIGDAAGHVLPPKLVHFLRAELTMIHLGLFRWNAPADIPAGSTAFAYHRYLTPMLATFLVLQLIELAVVHLLLSLWNETVAYILLAASIWGVVWITALLKSFRIRPVLITADGIHVRSGSIIDAMVPFRSIKAIVPMFDAERLKQKNTLNCAILSSPNVCLELDAPVEIATLFGGTRMVDAVALRLDDSRTFQESLRERLAGQNKQESQ